MIPYSEADLAARILSGTRALEIRRLHGKGLDADRIIMAELRFIAANLALRGDTPVERGTNYRTAQRIINSRTFSTVSARIRGAIRAEQHQAVQRDENRP